MTITKEKELIQDSWQQAWNSALKIWGPYTRLRQPVLCFTEKEAAKEGLASSFAMIRLNDQSIVIDLEKIKADQLQDYAVEILAHEIGHHIYAPANLTDNAKIIARILPCLPSLESRAAMVANLYTDLLINHHLKRQHNLRMDEIYQRINTQESNSKVWKIYMRIYELLWQLPKNNLRAGEITEDAMEGDAWLGARIIKVYAGDWLKGASRFAALLLPYLNEDKEEAEALAKLLDTRDAGKGQIPGGLIQMGEEDLENIHPSADPSLTGDVVDVKARPKILQEPNENLKRSAGQCREPFQYGEILRAAGIDLSDHEIAVRYYKERASPLLVPFPHKKQPQAFDPHPEGTRLWEPGESLENIDWFQSLGLSPVVIPGVTTVQREWGQSPGIEPEIKPMDLDLYVDCSGSMPNPQIEISYTALAGAILCLSALRSGASVQVTLWSGARQFIATPGFVRNEKKILEVLTGYLGGSTAFPIHMLRETHCVKPRKNASHIVILSDDGVTTMFDKDEKGNSGWDIAAQALKNARGGGTMVLNLPWDIELNLVQSYWQQHAQLLLRAQDEQGWSIFPVSSWEAMIQFARDFSRKVYSLSLEKQETN